MTRTRRWTIALALVLTAAALAGCIGSEASPGDAAPRDADEETESVTHETSASDEAKDSDEESGPDDGDEASNADDRATEAGNGTGNETNPSAVPSSMTFSGCDVQVGVFEVPAALAAEKIPEGFQPTSVVQPAAPTASFVVDAHNCEKATSDALEDPVEASGWVSYFLAVDPPDAYEDESVDFYFLPVASIADAPEVADVFEAWDVTVEEGTVDLSATTTPAARTGQLEVESNNISSTLHTAVSSEAAEGDPDHRARWFQVSDGEVTSIVQPTVSASGAFLGWAERVVETAPSDPGDLPFWAAVNPATRGVSQHLTAERIAFEHLDPAGVAGR